MSHTFLLGTEITLVVWIRSSLNSYVLRYFQTVSLQAHTFHGIIGHQPHFVHSYLTKNLGTHTIITLVCQMSLSVGEPDFNTPDHIKEAAKKAIDDNFSRYSPVPGYPALRNAIVEKLKKENGLEYTAAQISCANGAKQSVCNAILVLVNPGDEVIVPAPYWVSYPEMVKLAEGTPVIVPAGIDQDFKITPAQLEAAITPKTKALILCSPSNPTGSV